MCDPKDAGRAALLFWVGRGERALAGPAVLLAVLLLAFVGGCTTNANVRLNPAETPLGRRAPNATRAATFARLVPLAQGGESKVRSRPEVVAPTSGPAAGPAGVFVPADA